MSVRVFIDGAAGTTGLDIAARLGGRGDVTLITLDDAARKDANARADALAGADFAILCLPDDAAREAAALAAGSGVRLIDASSAHRTAADWSYGFAELSTMQRSAIAGGGRVSNPGCYATGFIALVAPLVTAGLVPADAALTCNAVSGYSGGGKAMISRYDDAAGAIGWRGYALTLNHKHVPEMQAHAGLMHAPLFTPAVVPVLRGMVVEVPLHRAADDRIAHPDMLRSALADHYAAATTVRVAALDADGEILLRGDAPPSDALMIGVYSSADGGQTRLIARLDNLGKGAGGACVQNLNIMAGLPETAGLRL